ncbi:MAG: hypothetical protein IJQ56_02925, partial [Synergistaceae bacterium]|nr:hypothetical protein [Synergistaceae bacterium]
VPSAATRKPITLLTARRSSRLTPSQGHVVLVVEYLVDQGLKPFIIACDYSSLFVCECFVFPELFLTLL